MTLPNLRGGAAQPADTELWRLTKGRRTAVCWQRLHPLGLELRIDVNRDTMRTTVARTEDEARTESARVHALMLEKGWTPA